MSSTGMRLMQGTGTGLFILCGETHVPHTHTHRKLLISDYNDLKARQQEQQSEEETQEKEDPTILKLKLA